MTQVADTIGAVAGDATVWRNSKELSLLRLGRRSYGEVWDLQRKLLEKRQARTIPDTLILVEHDPVYTLGKNAREEHLLQSRRRDVPVFHVERGGDVTFHGPGQLVGYPIMDLHDHRLSVSWYMRSLEAVIIRTLRRFDIQSQRREGLTGVWVGDGKIAALGVRLSRWVSMHGFALNIKTDLTFFHGIVPCGIVGYSVVSMEAILEAKLSLRGVEEALITEFLNIFRFHLLKET
ncbi:MAG: lipoyl(octanoyl) transferase LipB, partial [Fidelibacterota bacterium]